MLLTVNDECLGNISSWGHVVFTRPTISVRDLIHARVRLEVERLSELRNAVPSTVALTQTEMRLNERAVSSPMTSFMLDPDGVDKNSRAERHAFFAEKAFEAGRYFLLLDNRQAESLDEEIDLARTFEVTFLLLTPLQGG